MSSAKHRAELLRRGLTLEYITLSWNAVGVVIVAIAAIQAGSVAFGGFALDSLIEIGASVVVVWQLKGTTDDREGVAMRLIGIAFVALAAYIAAEAIYTLLRSAEPAVSPLGIAWTAVTCIAMLALAFGNRAQAKRSTIQCFGPKVGAPWWTRIWRRQSFSDWC